MNSILVYSFRTNKHLTELKKADINVFVFAKLKDSLSEFQQLIDEVQPNYIIGLAEIKTKSRFETLAINSFGLKSKVNKSGKNSYLLYIPPKTVFLKSKNSTRSFCNWTMYKISEMIDHQNVKNSFIHFNKKDLTKVIDFVKNVK